MMKKLLLIILAAAFCLPGWAKDEGKKLPAHAKVFLAPMGGVENDLKTAIEKKKVPVEIVAERDKAGIELIRTPGNGKDGKGHKGNNVGWDFNEPDSNKVRQLQ